MKKKRKWFLAGCCVFSLLMTACGTNTVQNVDTASVSVPVQSGTAAKETGTPAVKAETEGGTESGKEAKPYRWDVFEDLGLKAEYLCGLDYESGSRCDVFRVTSEAEENLILQVDDIRLNEDISTDANVFFSTEPGKETDSRAPSLTQSILLAERDGIVLKSISGVVQVYSWEWDEDGNEKMLMEKPFEVSFPDHFTPELICEPSYDMLAGEQVLSDENGVRITLNGCGGYYGAADGISGILCIENHSGKAIPYRISAAEVNGRTVEIYTDGAGSGNLPDGAMRYFDFRVSESTLEEAGITSVAEMQLQILTNAEQDTGVSIRSAGGSWYPLKLVQHGDPSDTFEAGEVIYEDDWVRLGYIDTRIDWYPEDEYRDEAYGYCNWDVGVVNKTDENIELQLADQVVDGVPRDEDDRKPFFKSEEIGPHAKRNTYIFLRIEENQVPEISFRIQVRRQGGGSLLNYAEDVVTIAPGEIQPPAGNVEEPEIISTESQ